MLPDYSIVHKQDFFIKENYQPDTERDELSFLSRSFERHFNERPFLNHYCYLFLTKTTRERSRRQSDFSTLCRGRIVPQEIADKEAAAKFIEAVGQFERIMNDSGFVTLTRLAASEITGQDGKAGIIEKYFSLSQTDTTCLKDIGQIFHVRKRVQAQYVVPDTHFFRVKPDVFQAGGICLREREVFLDDASLSVLSRSFERHFNERPFLNHYCYLFLTKTTRERSRRQSDFSTLCRGRIVPQEIADRETAMKFIEAVGQFERIMNDSGFVTLTLIS